jgi:hypothetical protein
LKYDDLARQLPIAPQAETGAVRIKQVRQGLELGPLRLVMGIGELAGIGALARRFHLDEADQSLSHRHRVIGPYGEVGESSLSHQINVAIYAAKHGESFDQGFKGRPQLIFRRALDGGIGEFGLCAEAEVRDRIRQCGSFRQGYVLKVT